MFRKLIIFIAGILMIGLTGCDLKTPEIRGVVLDAETKQPLKGAWLTPTLEAYSKTIAGQVHQSLFIGRVRQIQRESFFYSRRIFK